MTVLESNNDHVGVLWILVIVSVDIAVKQCQYSNLSCDTGHSCPTKLLIEKGC